MVARPISGASKTDDFSEVEIVVQCGRKECSSLLILTGQNTGKTPTATVYKIDRVVPTAPKNEQFNQTIKDVSPTFIEIYLQTDVADSHGLDQLVGMGLRKSLEFLVKDFASHRNPNDVASIEKMALADVIVKYSDDPTLKEVAKRAAWLGNDETHYTRKWVGLDVTHLRDLIRLTVLWIERIILSDKMIQSMPASGPPPTQPPPSTP